MTTRTRRTRLPPAYWLNPKDRRPPRMRRAWAGPVDAHDRNDLTAHDLFRRSKLIARQAMADHHAQMSSRRADMFVDLATDPRAEPPPRADERATLMGFLGWQRGTLELKCAGLDAEALARRAVPPSTMSLLGLVRHLAEVERGWFRRFMAGEDAPPHFNMAADGDFVGAVAEQETVDEAWRLWRAEMENTDRFVAAAPALEMVSEREDADRGRMSLRWVLTHLIEEYARHNGHADLLRERIDGRLGQ